MTDLVTGATGFIGSYLAERLIASGRPTRVLCRSGSENKLPASVSKSAEISIGDLRDRESLIAAAAGVTRIFHCAGHVQDWGTPGEFDDANVRGTRWLFEAAVAAGTVKRFVHFSSIAVFGTPSPPRFDDDTPFADAPRDGYTRTKIEGERIAKEFAQQLDVVILRPAVVYGRRGTWLEQPLHMIEQGKMALLGGGVGTCHPCYIENLIDATMLAAEHPAAKGRAYIVADDDPITFRDYFNGVASLAGKGPIKRSVPLSIARLSASAMELGAKAIGSKSRPLLTQTAIDMVTTKSTMSMKRVERELGFAPRYKFADALKQLQRQP